MDSKIKEQLDKQNSKLKTNEIHHLKWVKIKDIAIMLNLDENYVFEKAKEFQLDITSEVTSINSRINQAVSKEFINFLSHNS